MDVAMQIATQWSSTVPHSSQAGIRQHKGITVMNEDTAGTTEPGQAEEEALTIEISDEELEAVCCGEKIPFTFSYYLIYCRFC
jgi:hypothetical protein